jgi:hypothetical protein
MPIADRATYLKPIAEILLRHWPDNRTVNLIFHGHSVPSGYFRTPVVDTFGSYPFQTLSLVKERCPTAVVNCIVTAIGGEHAESGATRFASQVLCHRPDVLCIDYALNDRRIGLEAANAA